MSECLPRPSVGRAGNLMWVGDTCMRILSTNIIVEYGIVVYEVEPNDNDRRCFVWNPYTPECCITAH